jgi:hypothetical protein
MITLSLIKGCRDCGSGAVKKMLHVPTLKIYAVKEQPLTNKEIR